MRLLHARHGGERRGVAPGGAAGSVRVGHAGARVGAGAPRAPSLLTVALETPLARRDTELLMRADATERPGEGQRARGTDRCSERPFSWRRFLVRSCTRGGPPTGVPRCRKLARGGPLRGRGAGRGPTRRRA